MSKGSSSTLVRHVLRWSPTALEENTITNTIAPFPLPLKSHSAFPYRITLLICFTKAFLCSSLLCLVRLLLRARSNHWWLSGSFFFFQFAHPTILKPAFCLVTANTLLTILQFLELMMEQKRRSSSLWMDHEIQDLRAISQEKLEVIEKERDKLFGIPIKARKHRIRFCV